MSKTPPKAEEIIRTIEANISGTTESIRLLHNELEAGAGTLIPLLRQYLDELRSVRMAFTTEIRDIMRSGAELGDLAKTGEDLNKFLDAIDRLKKTFDDETIAKLRRVIRE